MPPTTRWLHRMALGLAAAVATAGLAGCAAPAPEDDEEATDGTSAIVGGTADDDHPTAGVLVWSDGGICGATLVAPNVVATAAHCLKTQPKDFYLGKGKAITALEPRDKALSTMKRYAVAEMALFPAFDRKLAFETEPSRDYVCAEETMDVALVRLASPVTDLEPTRLGGAPAVGAACEVVGYSTNRTKGATYETTMERRSANRKVTSTPTLRILSANVDGRTMHGDSGGALFCKGKLVGVLSCSSASGDDHARLDRVEAWIDQRLAAWKR